MKREGFDHRKRERSILKLYFVSVIQFKQMLFRMRTGKISIL